jgi:hypothetical protein
MLRRIRTGILSNVALCLGLIAWLEMGGVQIRACGIDWQIPRSFFEGTDSQGHVLVGKNLGEIKLPGGMTIPLIALFDSSVGATSPYVGKGWQLPLLESKVVQVDENTFRLEQPDGLFRLFWRSKKTPQIYEGQGGWKAEVRGAQVKAYAACGAELEFDRGRLVAMTLKEDRLEFDYDGQRVRSIRSNGIPILQTQSASRDVNVLELIVNGNKRIELTKVERPRFQTVNGRPLVVAMDWSVGQITMENGKVLNVAYPQPNEPDIESIDVDGRKLDWNSQSRKILRDGDWSYDVKPGEGKYDNAAITRTNGNGKSEFWHSDGAKGRETIKKLDGTELVTYWFTSGILAGKIRRKEAIENGVKKAIYSASYDEKGELIRENGVKVRRIYDSLNRLVREYRGEDLVLERIYDGDRLTLDRNGKQTTSYKYLTPAEVVDLVVPSTLVPRKHEIALIKEIDRGGVREILYLSRSDQLLGKIDHDLTIWTYDYLSNGQLANTFIDGIPYFEDSNRSAPKSR